MCVGFVLEHYKSGNFAVTFPALFLQVLSKQKDICSWVWIIRIHTRANRLSSEYTGNSLYLKNPGCFRGWQTHFSEFVTKREVQRDCVCPWGWGLADVARARWGTGDLKDYCSWILLHTSLQHIPRSAPSFGAVGRRFGKQLCMISHPGQAGEAQLSQAHRDLAQRAGCCVPVVGDTFCPSVGHWRRTVPRRVTAAHRAGVMSTGFFHDCQGSSCCPGFLEEKGLSTAWACSALPA